MTITSPWTRKTTFAVRLRAARAAANLSREEAAAACGPGFSARTWKRWETDPIESQFEKTPSLARLTVIADVLCVDRERLAFGGNEVTPGYLTCDGSQLTFPIFGGAEAIGREVGDTRWTTTPFSTPTLAISGPAGSPTPRCAPTGSSTGRSFETSPVAA